VLVGIAMTLAGLLALWRVATGRLPFT
jgi:hypothetical protein